jgi:hypothetical protein
VVNANDDHKCTSLHSDMDEVMVKDGRKILVIKRITKILHFECWPKYDLHKTWRCLKNVKGFAA